MFFAVWIVVYVQSGLTTESHRYTAQPFCFGYFPVFAAAGYLCFTIIYALPSLLHRSCCWFVLIWECGWSPWVDKVAKLYPSKLVIVCCPIILFQILWLCIVCPQSSNELSSWPTLACFCRGNWSTTLKRVINFHGGITQSTPDRPEIHICFSLLQLSSRSVSCFVWCCLCPLLRCCTVYNL